MGRGYANRVAAPDRDSTHVHLRVARVSDAHGITELLRASYGTLLASHYDSGVLAAALPSITVASAALLMSGTFFVAETQDASIVGTGGWAPRPPTGEQTAAHVGHLRQFAVAPGCTGEGIGTQIAERCIETVRAEGLTCVEALATLDAIDFFAGLGFERVQETTLPLGRVELPVVQMKRPL